MLWALLLAALAAAASPARADEVPWLYEVAVPVEDQSSVARLEATGRALAQLLSRLTGLASVPRNETVARALAAPDLYYSQFRFEEAEDGEGLRLRLQFVPRAVLDLVREARLPIWRSNRPTVMGWVVTEDERGERRILGAGADHPLVESLETRARERGVPLRLPIMDLADQLAVEPAAVWGRLSQVLQPASARYGADVLLVGRLQRMPDQNWAASFEIWVDDDLVSREFEASGADMLGRAAADLVADELAGRYAVLDRGLRRLDLAISAVHDAHDYAELLRYFGSLEFVEQVMVSSVSGDRIGVSLITPADPEQLLELFALDRHLFPDRLNDIPGAALQLVWQRR